VPGVLLYPLFSHTILQPQTPSELRDLGLKDYQVPGLAGEHLAADTTSQVDNRDSVLSALHLVYMIAHLLLLLALAAVPVLLLNLPVGMLAGLYAESRRKKALAASKVKVRGYDVRLCRM
jgi:glycerol-3-phosphate O-acyltransferase / dihydroxyacetone phosphate acyltransferase